MFAPSLSHQTLDFRGKKKQQKHKNKINKLAKVKTNHYLCKTILRHH
jgi:hypothetical protein